MVKQKYPKPKPMGRPSLSGPADVGERSPVVGIRFAPKDLRAIDALADREGVKRSEMIRRLLEAGQRVYKSGKAK
jgi:hypothetical protein